MSANYFVNILWTSKILSITQSKKAQIISYDMIYAWLHTDFSYIVLNWPDYIWVIRLCTPGYPSDTCLNRFLPSIRQMLKQDPADPNNPKGTDVFMFAAASTEAPMTYFSRKTIIAPSNNFLQSLTIFPTAMALISVPSLTPFNLWDCTYQCFRRQHNHIRHNFQTDDKGHRDYPWWWFSFLLKRDCFFCEITLL